MPLRTTIAFAALASALVFAAPRAQAAPLLYVYEGAGCTGVDSLPPFEAFLDRKVDGVVDYVDYLADWPTAASGTGWTLGCWKGHASNIAYGVPLAVDRYTPAKGSNQLAEVAAGKMDAYFERIGAALVSHGFPNAYIRLGWEENGGWYPWSAAAHPGDFAAAFAHVMKLLKATPGSHFTVLYNPTTGQNANIGFPAKALPDVMAWDVYANTYNSGGVGLEPGLWNGNLNDYWGLASIGNAVPSRSFYGQLPVAIPEFGVGSGSNHNGAPSGLVIDTAGTITGTQVKNGGDDPYYMRQALAFFFKLNAKFIGYWDYNDGSGALSKISNGSRPHEALELLNVFGSRNQKAIFNASAKPFTKSPPPALTCTGCHAVAFQNAPGHFMIVVWVIQPHPKASLSWGASTQADLYDPAVGTAPIQALGAATSWTGAVTPGRPLVIGLSQ